MNVLVTGGTGSLGQALVKALLHRGAVTVYSRDELKQWDMAQRVDARFVLGDIRDRDRLVWAAKHAHVILHAAALKHVPVLEKYPDEAVATNVVGTQNVIAAARHHGIQRVLGISTDKAAGPITAYGASKLLAERLLCAAGFSAVRLGNIAGSTGSLIPYWRSLAAQGKALPLTDRRMTRHWMSVDEATAFVLRSLDRMQGGEVFIPRTRSFRVADLWRLMTTEHEPWVTGRRAGEKMHEVMIAPDEAAEAFCAGEDIVLNRAIGGVGLALPRLADTDTSSERATMSVDELRKALEAA